MKKLNTNLFMIMSVDGKISTGNTNERDIDKDFWKIKGILEGLTTIFYDLEQKTDLYSLNTGKVMSKIGVNTNFNNVDFMNKIIESPT